jgi:hypothetical protein
LTSESAPPVRTASMRPRVAITRCRDTPAESRWDSTSLTYCRAPEVVILMNMSPLYARKLCMQDIPEPDVSLPPNSARSLTFCFYWDRRANYAFGT